MFLWTKVLRIVHPFPVVHFVPVLGQSRQYLRTLRTERPSLEVFGLRPDAENMSAVQRQSASATQKRHAAAG
jgi:hypothetical protein